MRVITGSAKGMRLLSPKNNRVRPTTDRIKEALFSIIGATIEDCIFVDCFAGTGSIGIEALSRGAKECFFIDNHPESVNIIKENLHKTNLISRGTIIPKNIKSGVKWLMTYQKEIDILFMDPPYLKGFIESTLEVIDQSNILHSSSWVIIEHSKEEILQEAYNHLIRFRKQVYGNTILSFYKKEDKI